MVFGFIVLLLSCHLALAQSVPQNADDLHPSDIQGKWQFAFDYTSSSSSYSDYSSYFYLNADGTLGTDTTSPQGAWASFLGRLIVAHMWYEPGNDYYGVDVSFTSLSGTQASGVFEDKNMSGSGWWGKGDVQGQMYSTEVKSDSSSLYPSSLCGNWTMTSTYSTTTDGSPSDWNYTKTITLVDDGTVTIAGQPAAGFWFAYQDKLLLVTFWQEDDYTRYGAQANWLNLGDGQTSATGPLEDKNLSGTGWAGAGQTVLARQSSSMTPVLGLLLCDEAAASICDMDNEDAVCSELGGYIDDANIFAVRMASATPDEYYLKAFLSDPDGNVRSATVAGPSSQSVAMADSSTTRWRNTSSILLGAEPDGPGLPQDWRMEITMTDGARYEVRKNVSAWAWGESCELDAEGDGCEVLEYYVDHVNMFAVRFDKSAESMPDQYWLEAVIHDPDANVASASITGPVGSSSMTYGLYSGKETEWWSDPNQFLGEEGDDLGLPQTWTMTITMKDGATMTVTKSVSSWEWAQ